MAFRCHNCHGRLSDDFLVKFLPAQSHVLWFYSCSCLNTSYGLLKLWICHFLKILKPSFQMRKCLPSTIYSLPSKPWYYLKEGTYFTIIRESFDCRFPWKRWYLTLTGKSTVHSGDGEGIRLRSGKKKKGRDLGAVVFIHSNVHFLREE